MLKETTGGKHKDIYMKLTETFNQIISLSEIGDLFEIGPIARTTFSFGEKRLIFKGENLTKYMGCISEAYSSEREIADTYTLKQFESIFIEKFEEKFRKKTQINDLEVNNFIKELKISSLKTFSIYRDIYGLKIEDKRTPCILGPFAIYDFNAHYQLIEGKTQVAHAMFWFNDKPELLIEYKSQARHIEKAIEKADENFVKFELTLRFIIGYKNEYIDVGILNYLGWRQRRAYVISDEGEISGSSSSHGPFSAIPIDNPYFQNKELGFDKVWNLMASDNKTELQKRILLAIEWVGQSICDLSIQSAFIKAAIALEITLLQNEKTIITPSILSQIAESVAIMLGRDTEQRLEIDRKVRRLYSMRSAVVHAGKNDITLSDYEMLLDAARKVIISLLTLQAFKNISSVAELHIELKKIKYSSGEIL